MSNVLQKPFFSAQISDYFCDPRKCLQKKRRYLITKPFILGLSQSLETVRYCYFKHGKFARHPVFYSVQRGFFSSHGIARVRMSGASCPRSLPTLTMAGTSRRTPQCYSPRLEDSRHRCPDHNPI